MSFSVYRIDHKFEQHVSVEYRLLKCVVYKHTSRFCVTERVGYRLSNSRLSMIIMLNIIFNDIGLLSISVSVGTFVIFYYRLSSYECIFLQNDRI